MVTLVFAKQYDSKEHAAFECVDDEECLAVTCTSASAPMHCRMVTRKAAEPGTTITPLANCKGYCLDRKLHRGIVLSPKRIKLSVPQRAASDPRGPMPESKRSAWKTYVAGEFERMDDPNGLGIYHWGRPVYRRITGGGGQGWDYLKWNSPKMHWEMISSSYMDGSSGLKTADSALFFDHARAATASDAPFPTTGRWQVTGFVASSTNGIENMVVTTEDDTQPSVCGDGAVQAGEDCDDDNLLPADGCSPACKTDVTDPAFVKISEHTPPSPPSRRRLSTQLKAASSSLEAARACLESSKDTDGDGKADCLDACPYDASAHLAEDCPVTLDLLEDPVADRLIITVEHKVASEVLLEIRFGTSVASVGPVAATSSDATGNHWSLSVHTPGWQSGIPFTVRAKTFINGMPTGWSNGICSREPPNDKGCMHI